MPRARGADVLHDVAFETVYGTTPAAGFFRLPLVSTALGAEQNLIEDDRLGKGREGYDPTYDVINNDGDHVVPVDDAAFGHWLKLAFGAPATTDNEDGTFDHVFTSGASSLPSAAIQIAHPKIPRYFVNRGVKLNTMAISMSRSGLLNATLGMIAKGETDFAATQSGTATAVSGARFSQATGSIKKVGAEIGNIVSAQFTFSNGLDKVETIAADGEIAGADEGIAKFSGSVTVRFADMTFYNAATGGDPIDLSFGWANDESSLVFATPRVFLPRAKIPVTGPAGIQATFNWQASGQEAAICTATLVNATASYA